VVSVLADGPANVADGVWPERIYRAVTRAELWSFAAERPRGQALVYAGGGYTSLMLDKEGVEVALWLNTLGFDAHVLVHRLPGQPAPSGGVFPVEVALSDGRAALAQLAATRPDLPLVHVGLSSGGHLSGTMACQPTALTVIGAIITYAPVNANHRDHKVPAGKPDYPPAEKQAFYDAWPIGLAEHPHGLPPVPLFLAYALVDSAVPVEHALRVVRTAAATGADVDLHVFGQAPHGFALRDKAGTHAAWPRLAAEWIDKHL
jgi:dienelactone hydrolase